MCMCGAARQVLPLPPPARTESARGLTRQAPLPPIRPSSSSATPARARTTRRHTHCGRSGCTMRATDTSCSPGRARGEQAATEDTHHNSCGLARSLPGAPSAPPPFPRCTHTTAGRRHNARARQCVSPPSARPAPPSPHARPGRRGRVPASRASSYHAAMRSLVRPGVARRHTVSSTGEAPGPGAACSRPTAGQCAVCRGNRSRTHCAPISRGTQIVGSASPRVPSGRATIITCVRASLHSS